MGLETAAIAAIASVAIPALIGVGKEVLGPGDSDVTQAGQQKLANMGQVSKATGAYRADQADARMKAMAQQLSGYQGAGNMMQSMYGGGGKADMGGYKTGSGGYKAPPPMAPPPPIPGAVPPPPDTWNPEIPRARPPGGSLPEWKKEPVPETPPPFDPTRTGWGNEPMGFTGKNPMVDALAARRIRGERA
jgi:hypothetical protein